MSNFKCCVDYYQVLQVNQGASQGQVKKIYYQYALRFHPDKNNGCTRAAEKFKKILAAYEVLVDPDLRSQYDMARVSHTSGRCYIISCGQDPEEASIWAEEASRDDCDCARCAKVKEEKLKKQREDELREQERLEREWAQKERLRMEQREKERKEARTRSRQPYKERVDPRNYTEEEAAAFQNAGTSKTRRNTPATLAVHPTPSILRMGPSRLVKLTTNSRTSHSLPLDNPRTALTGSITLR